MRTPTELRHPGLGGMTLREVALVCARHRGFVEQWSRLTGKKFVLASSPIEAAIDDAVGANDDAAASFVAFVYEFVFTRIPPTTPTPAAPAEVAR